MRIRTSLIFACMTVVPLMALLSHRVPGEVRAAVRCRLWEPIESWVASLSRGRPQVATDDGPADPPPSAAALPAVGPESVPTPAPGVTEGRDALAALGAVAIDCRPLDGVTGTHVAACRVAIDDAGQLHRVFQAAGRSPDEALAALVDVVRGWQRRVAGGSTRAAAPLRF